MFYRGTLQSKGSGLGLYIVKETVARMGGTIELDSVPGEGCSFVITFPAFSRDTGYTPAQQPLPRTGSTNSEAFAEEKTRLPAIES